MNLTISISKQKIVTAKEFFSKILDEKLVLILSAILSVAATVFNFVHDWIVVYGDSESHLNIAKRVADSITPGLAQLGGIWLPIPHILMLPFVWSDTLWRTGLAGSIVSGAAFVVAAVFLYKTMFLLSKNKIASFAVALVFMLNPNALYMQSTPMTEMLLIAFFTLSTFYFIQFLLEVDQLKSLLLAGLFGFCAVLSRYDGWFLVALEAGAIVLYYLPLKNFSSVRGIKEFFQSSAYKKMEGYIFLFVTIAFLGIIIWLMWDFLILGDPLYFAHSEFSARSQQEVWQGKGELPAYHNIGQAVLYYLVTAMSNAGVLIFFPALLGFLYYISDKANPRRWLVALILATPFIFNILTLFMGQSVIFIRHLTPLNFEHSLFNVRYGLMALPLLAIGWGMIFLKSKSFGKLVLIGLFFLQFAMYGVGYSKVITWQDGTEGLSSAQRPDAERWIKDHYDFGLVLMDDYARTVSIVRSHIPMQNMIYIGNKPYWEESLVEPEKHAEWIVMQENDAVYQSLWQIPARKARLQKNYDLMYKSVPGVGANISIFKKKRAVAQEGNEVSNSSLFWNYQCVDTMKYSRDQARVYGLREDFDQFLTQEMSLIKDMGANCVSIGTPYDEEFVPYLTRWVKKAREYGLIVWFRGNLSGWEGWFDYPKFTDVQQHHNGIKNLITKHPELFEAGDIFTPAPEPENGIIGDPRDSSFNRSRFVQFLPDSYNNCVSSFAEIKKDVTCGFYGFNGDVAKQIIDKDLLVKIGDVIVIDHYVKTAEQLATDVKYLHDKLDALVMIGEFGAPIPDIHGPLTEQQQAQFIGDNFRLLYELRDSVIGMNYWVMRGGSTALVSDNGVDKKAGFGTIQAYFKPTQVRGTVLDTLGDPVVGAKIQIKEFDLETKTDELGLYEVNLPADRNITIAVSADKYSGDSERKVQLAAGKDIVTDFELTKNERGLWYRIKLWWKHVTD